jgi:L-amino acid N-acyltransferase YncA
MNSELFFVREATLEDSVSIGTIQAKTWKTTYAGIVHQSFLDSFEAEPRIQSAQKRFYNPELKDLVLVEKATDQVVGFVVIGPNREKNVDADSEIHAIYILQKNQNYGGGKLLYQAAVKEIRNRNSKKMMVSVLEDNKPSRKFYEAMGGKYIGSDHVDIEQNRYKTATYLWQF